MIWRSLKHLLLLTSFKLVASVVVVGTVVNLIVIIVARRSPCLITTLLDVTTALT